MCCRVLQCVAVCWGKLQYVDGYHAQAVAQQQLFFVLQCVVVCCSGL